MFFLGYFKGQPTEYIVKYVGGQAVAEGHGLACFRLTAALRIVAVPNRRA